MEDTNIVYSMGSRIEPYTVPKFDWAKGETKESTSAYNILCSSQILTNVITSCGNPIIFNLFSKILTLTTLNAALRSMLLYKL